MVVGINNGYLGFNGLDLLVGKGDTPEQQRRNRALRRAISIASAGRRATAASSAPRGRCARAQPAGCVRLAGGAAGWVQPGRRPARPRVARQGPVPAAGCGRAQPRRCGLESPRVAVPRILNSPRELQREQGGWSFHHPQHQRCGAHRGRNRQHASWANRGAGGCETVLCQPREGFTKDLWSAVPRLRIFES